MSRILQIYLVGAAILAVAVAWNTLLPKLGVKSAYDLLKDPRKGRVIDYALFICAYPLLLGAVSVFIYQLFN
jgi:hypothetical protein